MNVSLTPTLEHFIQKKVNDGFYYSASEVVREGLRLLEEKDKLKQLKLQDLRKEIKKGLNSLHKGKGIPGAQVFDDLISHHNKKYKSQ